MVPREDTTPVRHRPGGRSARVRVATLAATVDELAAVGYGGFSIESVARRAGVNKTTIYRRWATAEALVLDAMLERAAERVPVPDTGSLRGDLRELARTALANASAPELEGILRASASERSRESALAQAAQRFWAERLVLDGEVVTRAVARGEVPPGTDPRLVIEAVLGPPYLRLLLTREPVDEAFIDRVVDLVVSGLRP